MIAVVVVTHSAPRAVLDACIESIQAAGGYERLVVVDNGGKAELFDTDVEVASAPNKGYGAAANLGFEMLKSDDFEAIALLNDDVIVQPDWLGPLVGELRGPGVGAAQPKLLQTGTDPAIVNSKGVTLGPEAAGVDIGSGDPDDDDETPADLAMFTGGAVLFSPDFLRETGGFDERYFLYYEDVDLAKRGESLGWRYRYVPCSVVEHLGSVSTSGDPDLTHFLQERNRLWVAVRFTGFPVIVRAFWLSVRRLRHTPRRLHGRALWAGVLGAPRRVMERRRNTNQMPS